MNVLTLINVVTNSVIGTSIMLFIISVFGCADHPIWEHKYRAYLAKIGLGITGCGAIAAVLLSLTNPPEADILFKVSIFQHIGLTLNFCWLSWWQYAESRKKITRFKSISPKILTLPIKDVPTPTPTTKRKYTKKRR